MERISSEEKKEIWRREEESGRREIAELEKPIQRILEQMLWKIEAGDYDVIIGDDASARVPTRILEKVVKNIYDTHHFEYPQIKFIAGSSWIHEEELKVKKEKILEYLNNLGLGEKTNRVLIVTDIISSGQSILAIGESLADLGVYFDVALMGFPISDDVVRIKIEHLGHGIVYAGRSQAEIYQKGLISGVAKSPQDLFAFKISHDKKFQKNLNQVRHDAFIVADHLIEWYNEKKKLENSN